MMNIKTPLSEYGWKPECDDKGKPLPGVTTNVLHEGKRPYGHYAVRITRDLSKSGQPALPSPGKVLP